YSFTFTIVPPTRRIHEIQGAAHRSPLEGQLVGNVPGIVTAKRSNGFNLQDPDPDASDATSEGIFVLTSPAPTSVSVGDAVTVNGSVNEIPVLPDDGTWAGPRTAHGGILYSYADGNPERIIVDDGIVPMPQGLNVGDHFAGSVTGVVDYNFGLFMVELTQSPVRVPGTLTKEITVLPTVNELTVATFNVQNLDPGDGAPKFNNLASLIVNNMKSPDLIAVEEVQDNNGATDNGVVDPAITISTLITAISNAGGPTYNYRQINPVNDQDGGEPGGNIRQIFLFRTDRGLSFVDRPGGDSTTPTTVTSASGTPQLSFSPGRIDPTNTAWDSSRKPLAAEFLFDGQRLFVIAN